MYVLIMLIPTGGLMCHVNIIIACKKNIFLQQYQKKTKKTKRILYKIRFVLFTILTIKTIDS